MDDIQLIVAILCIFPLDSKTESFKEKLQLLLEDYEAMQLKIRQTRLKDGFIVHNSTMNSYSHVLPPAQISALAIEKVTLIFDAIC